MNAIRHNIIYKIVVFSLAVAIPAVARAFTPDTYTGSSVLSEGRWVKINVSRSGIHLITAADLRRWGFADPANVKVYGYGGEPSDDILSRSSYIDDLPEVMSEATERGVFFFARGPQKWRKSTLGGYTSQPNYYSLTGTYFLTEGTPSKPAAKGKKADDTSGAATSFIEKLVHEVEIISPGTTGHTFLGEDLSSSKSLTLDFDLPSQANDSIMINCAFAAKTVQATPDQRASQVTFVVNGNELPSNSGNTFSSNSTDSHRHYFLKEIYQETKGVNGKAQITINYTTNGIIRLARLDKLCVSYFRTLTMPAEGTLDFTLEAAKVSFSGAGASTRIWDVTYPAASAPVDAALSGSTLTWIPATGGEHRYVAWNPDADYPAPTFGGAVYNQNLHGLATPDMVIFTTSEWHTYANQLADLHREDPDNPLSVEVIDQDVVFNEFSSGTPDFNAFRRLLKMFYDRGSADGHELKYCLMFGRGIYDHRGVTREVSLMRSPVLLQWQSIDASSDNTSYTSEDYLAFLRDNSGTNPGNDTHCIAVGRIPVTSESECKAAIEKVAAYMADKNPGDWKLKVLLAADNSNDDTEDGIHQRQMEEVFTAMNSTSTGRSRIYTKVYVDAFPLVDNVANGAHDRMFRNLNRGVAWWWFIGHANTFSWTAEGLLTRNDLETASFGSQPMLYAATCDFLRWDLLDTSGAEALFFNPAGIIGAIAATRPVYITYNKQMSLALAAKMYSTDMSGRPLPIGEMLRQAKNTLLGGDTNKLRYVLLGDPALAVTVPDYLALLDRINGEEVNPDAQLTIKASELVKIEGRITHADSTIIDDFNGTLIPTIFDAEHSTTGLGHNGGPEMTFEEQGDALYIGRAPVSAGHFSLDVAMPAEISANFRPAAMSLYAFSPDGRDAGSVNRDFYVFGFDESGSADTTPPVIEQFVLNSPAFMSGATVNSAPTVLARVSDNVGINISSAGIGHRLSLVLDATTSFSDFAECYEPGDDGAVSGSIVYPLSGLTDGSHSLRLRVWDTSNNYAEKTIEFNVHSGKVAQLLTLSAETAPSRDVVNFHIEHNLPGRNVEVELSIYDTQGRRLWSDSRTCRDGSLASKPFSWPMTDASGRAVSGGLYLYRATVTASDGSTASATRKLALTR